MLRGRAIIMSKSKGFTLVELLVVIAIIALLMSILMPALRRVRKQAQGVLCQSNLHQWATILLMYANDNEGSNPEGWNSGKMWMTDLEPYYGGEGDIRLCPVAKKFLHTVPGNYAGTFTAWGIWGNPNYFGGTIPYWARKGLYGSYGINSWIHSPRLVGVPNSYNHTEADLSLHWKTINVKGAYNVPAFGGCMWDGTNPDSHDDPPTYEGLQIGNGMNVFCLNRHSGTVGLNFLDGSARLVGLKELWTLKWHRLNDTCAEWTKCGDVERDNWPEWMRPLKEY
ncbi:MAG: type II secretion system protein [Planctomycetota bacterium]|nr:MAG: type II secretion system protein [Planctomycetota bacterium]